MSLNHMMEEYNDHNYTLTIRKVEEADLGEYTCNAVNKISDASATVSLTGKSLIQPCYQ